MPNPKLVATYYTLAGPVYPGGPDASPHSFERRAQAAGAAGYYGIGVSGYDLAASIERYGRRGMRQVWRDAGLSFLEIECLIDWFATGETRIESDEMRALWLDAAEDVGATHFKVVGDLRNTGVSLEKMADEFRLFCRQAAERGVYLSLEIFPEANIDTIEKGRALMDLVDLGAVTNGGLLIDIWHITRPGIPYAEIEALPKNYIAHVEIDDAAEEMIGPFFDDTMLNRLLPGEGSFDVPAFLRSVQKTGYDGLFGVEILSETIRALEPELAAKRSFDASMTQFQALGPIIHS